MHICRMQACALIIVKEEGKGRCRTAPAAHFSPRGIPRARTSAHAGMATTRHCRRADMREVPSRSSSLDRIELFSEDLARLAEGRDLVGTHGDAEHRLGPAMPDDRRQAEGH